MKDIGKKVLTFFTSLARPHPLRDWYLLLGVTIFGTIFLAFIAVNFFLDIRSGSPTEGTDTNLPGTPSVSREALQEVVDIYDARQVNYNESNVRLPNISDPSN